jgi:hypothetical protein
VQRRFLASRQQKLRGYQAGPRRPRDAFTHDHINAFAIVSGDSDFICASEQAQAVRQTGIGGGWGAFTSTILQKNCHEFVSYELIH